MTFKITFGTDGWRGVIAEDYTFDNVRRCAQGFASYLLKRGKQGQWIVVGHDKRFGSENFAVAVAEVLAGNGESQPRHRQRLQGPRRDGRRDRSRRVEGDRGLHPRFD